MYMYIPRDKCEKVLSASSANSTNDLSLSPVLYNYAVTVN